MDITFDDASYSRFLNEKRTEYNSRLRNNNETFLTRCYQKKQI